MGLPLGLFLFTKRKTAILVSTGLQWCSLPFSLSWLWTAWAAPRLCRAEARRRTGGPKSDRLLHRLRQRREGLRPRLGHVPAILEADAELARDVESRLVGEAHAGLERRAVASHEVGRLVHVHPDAVAGAMREPRQAVVLAPALLLVEGADGLVDRPDRRADLRRLQRELLSALHRVPELALARRGRTGDPAAGDVGLVAVDRAAGVDEDDRALVDALRLDRAVRKSARLIQQHQSELVRATEGGVRRHHQARDVGIAHARLDAAVHVAQRRDRDVVGGLHEGKLRRRLDHATGAPGGIAGG